MIDQFGMKPVPLELLDAVARESLEPSAPKSTTRAPNPSSNGSSYTSRLIVETWLTDRGRGFHVKREQEGKGRTVFVLAECPFDASHANPDACIMQDAHGKMSAKCFHNSCQGRGWQEFKEKIGKPEAHHFDPPLKRNRAPKSTGAVQTNAPTKPPAVASAEIPLPEGAPLNLMVSPRGRQPQRLVVATRGVLEHRDRMDTDSSTSRERFIKKLAVKIGVDNEILAPQIETKLLSLASEMDERSPSPTGQDENETTQSQATLAVNMAADWELWHTPSKEAYATIFVDDHKENWPVKSQTFKRFVARQFFNEQGKAMNSDALSAAVNLLEAKAFFEGDEHPVYVRVAENGGNIYLDLCNSDWEVIRITTQGWSVVDDPPTRFRRSRGMLPLPVPERGGHIDQLREFVHLDDNAWRLLVCWLVATLCPRGPYPILALFAQHGSGKSTIGRLLRSLVDPNAAMLRAEPRDGRDLMIAANNSWCLAFDNLSYIPPWLSDAFCRLSTGGGFATRELFTDQDEVIFDSQRPVLLTSIEEVAERSDLLDRCLILWLPEIPEDRRRTEAELFEAFRMVRSKILGALLDAVHVALRRLPSIKLPGLPRMADFASWATAAETAFGWPSDTFMAAYQGNRESANEVALEASVVARPLLDLLETSGEWTGSSGELLKLLEERQGDEARRLTGWPKNPRSLSGHLKRLAPNLRTAGWVLEQDRSSKKRLWTISLAPARSTVSSREGTCKSMPSNAEWSETEQHDANDADDATAGEGWNPDRY